MERITSRITLDGKVLGISQRSWGPSHYVPYLVLLLLIRQARSGISKLGSVGWVKKVYW